MNAQHISALTFLAAAILPCAPARAAEAVYRDAATHESLVPAYRAVAAQDPMKNLEASEGGDPSAQNPPQNLIESSDLISFQGLTTLVPKRAILQLPEAYRDRVNRHQPGNRVVGWLEFYAANRGWITTIEVTRGQAGGNEPFAEGLRKQLAVNRNLIVTVMDSGPISYQPYRGDAERNQAANAKQP
jgi:hypothetical protein